MPTILLVDNDPLQAFLRKSILEQRFDDVQRVADAAEALCRVEQSNFARNLGLVISGQHMQGIGGPAFVAELHERLPQIPVLVLGNASDAQDDYTGASVCFLAKPFAAEDVVAAASVLLAQREPRSTGDAFPLAAQGQAG
jgi:CheY-like chemotaxis protein